VQQRDGVRDERFQIIHGLAVRGVDFLERKRLGAEGFQHFVIVFDLIWSCSSKRFALIKSIMAQPYRAALSP